MYVSHGSVATQLKCGWTFNNYVIGNCPENVTVEKKMKICYPVIFGEKIDTALVEVCGL